MVSPSLGRLSAQRSSGLLGLMKLLVITHHTSVFTSHNTHMIDDTISTVVYDVLLTNIRYGIPRTSVRTFCLAG